MLINNNSGAQRTSSTTKVKSGTAAKKKKSLAMNKLKKAHAQDVKKPAPQKDQVSLSSQAAEPSSNVGNLVNGFQYAFGA